MSAAFVVTAFGPFGGVPVNPTQTVLEALPAHLAQRPLPAGASLARAAVLPVEARAAHAQLRALSAEAAALRAAGARVLAVHLGVNTRGACVELECRAANEANFRRASVHAAAPHCTYAAGPRSCSLAQG